jgi:hypothetical protein
VDDLLDGASGAIDHPSFRDRLERVKGGQASGFAHSRIHIALKGENVLWKSTDDGSSMTHVHLATASLTGHGEILSSKVQSVAWTANTQDPAWLASDKITLTVTVRVPNGTGRVRVIVATADGERMGTADVDRKAIDTAPATPSPEPQLLRR